MTSGGRKMIKAMVSEILMLSSTEQVYVARLWAREVFGMRVLKKGGVFKGKKFGGKKDIRLLNRIGNEFMRVAYMDKGLEVYMESLYMSNMELTPKAVAWRVHYYKRIRREMMPWLVYLARKVKKKLLARRKCKFLAIVCEGGDKEGSEYGSRNERNSILQDQRSSQKYHIEGMR